MAQVAPTLTRTDVLEAIANGFLDELRAYFPTHVISVCKIKNGWIIEGEREALKPKGFSYTTVLIWYNVIFLPGGVRIDGIHGRARGEYAYEDPKLLDYIKHAVYEYTKSW